jgi:hypothetical protein
MKGLSTSLKVTFDAGTMLFLTDVTLQVKPAEVHLTPVILQTKIEQKYENSKLFYLQHIIIFKPDLVVPIDTSMMNPLFALHFNNSAFRISTQHTLR